MRLFVVSACLFLSAPVAAEVSRTGTPDGFGYFGYCAPPVPPACVDAAASYAASAALMSCKDEVQRYVQTVAAYRLCLARETERAVLQVNAVLDRYKCRSSRPRPVRCP